MLKRVFIGLCALLFSSALVSTTLSAGPAQAPSHPHVLVTTSQGEIELELYQDKAPVSVANFLAYVDRGFYDGTIFHRVIPNFMIQGGGFTSDMKQKPALAPIKNEADNGLKNQRGTIAMARTANVNSATSQFFINTKDNDFLDHGSRDFGYAVFGKVVKGLDIVDKIGAVPTSNSGMFQDTPRTPVIIQSIHLL